MGSQVSVLRNSQRGIIFMVFLVAVVAMVGTILRFVKGRIDIPDGRYVDEKKDEQPKVEQASDEQMKKEKTQESGAQPVDMNAPIEKVMKKMHEMNTLLLPFLLLLFVLCLDTGTSYTFSMVWFFIVLVPMVLFNIAKIQMSLFSSNVVRVIFESFFYILILPWLLNIWTIIPASDPYFLMNG